MTVGRTLSLRGHSSDLSALQHGELAHSTYKYSKKNMIIYIFIYIGNSIFGYMMLYSHLFTPFNVEEFDNKYFIIIYIFFFSLFLVYRLFHVNNIVLVSLVYMNINIL